MSALDPSLPLGNRALILQQGLLGVLLMPSRPHMAHQRSGGMPHQVAIDAVKGDLT
jgi:hypothetical protein